MVPPVAVRTKMPLYIDHGNPENIASIYSGTSTDFTNTDPVIYRPPLFRRPAESGYIPDYRLLRTEQDSRWLNGKPDCLQLAFFMACPHSQAMLNADRPTVINFLSVCHKMVSY